MQIIENCIFLLLYRYYSNGILFASISILKYSSYRVWQPKLDLRTTDNLTEPHSERKNMSIYSPFMDHYNKIYWFEGLLSYQLRCQSIEVNNRRFVHKGQQDSKLILLTLYYLRDVGGACSFLIIYYLSQKSIKTAVLTVLPSKSLSALAMNSGQ